MSRRLALAFACALAAGPSAGQDGLPEEWRCVMNSNVVSLDVLMKVATDNTIRVTYGAIVYRANGRIFDLIETEGRWLVGRSPDRPNEPLLQIQFLPTNHASFSIFTRPTSDPGMLYNREPDMVNGGEVITACQTWKQPPEPGTEPGFDTAD